MFVTLPKSFLWTQHVYLNRAFTVKMLNVALARRCFRYEFSSKSLQLLNVASAKVSTDTRCDLTTEGDFMSINVNSDLAAA